MKPNPIRSVFPGMRRNADEGISALLRANLSAVIPSREGGNFPSLASYQPASLNEGRSSSLSVSRFSTATVSTKYILVRSMRTRRACRLTDIPWLVFRPGNNSLLIIYRTISVSDMRDQMPRKIVQAPSQRSEQPRILCPEGRRRIYRSRAGE